MSIQDRIDRDGKPAVKLVGEDGNALTIISRCKKAAKDCDWTREEMEDLMDEMMGGDYNNLLRVAMKYFEVT